MYVFIFIYLFSYFLCLSFFFLGGFRILGFWDFGFSLYFRLFVYLVRFEGGDKGFLCCFFFSLFPLFFVFGSEGRGRGEADLNMGEIKLKEGNKKKTKANKARERTRS